MNKLDDLIEFNDRLLNFKSFYIAFKFRETKLHMIVGKYECPEYRFLFPYDFDEIRDTYENVIIKQIGLNLKYINDYITEYIYRDDVFELIFFVKESFPHLNESIDSMIEDESNFTNTPENYIKLKKDLILFNNIKNINNGLLSN